MKQQTQKPAIAFKTPKETNNLLKQIHSGGSGNCIICKKVNLTGFNVYSIDVDRKIFLCRKCYIIGS